jgi:multidrug efflux pump subunit AcrA (membrane-fusion protein)
VPNPDGALRPGFYVDVQFGIPRPVPTVLIPADALLFNADGLRVATVDDAGRVHNIPVKFINGATARVSELRRADR